LFGDRNFLDGVKGLNVLFLTSFLEAAAFASVDLDGLFGASPAVTDLVVTFCDGGGRADTLVDDFADLRNGVCTECIDTQLGRILNVSVLSLPF
jgi:hypothetical protein